VVDEAEDEEVPEEAHRGELEEEELCEARNESLSFPPRDDALYKHEGNSCKLIPNPFLFFFFSALVVSSITSSKRLLRTLASS